MPKIESFQQRLVRLRKARGFTQEELADMTGFSRRMIAHYETRIKDIPPSKALTLAKILQISMDELLGHKSLPKLDVFKNRKLLRKMKLVDQLPRREQKKVMDYINDIAAKYDSTKHS
jgi:transcriptional regulator with XRE-family HTH domain